MRFTGHLPFWAGAYASYLVYMPKDELADHLIPRRAVWSAAAALRACLSLQPDHVPLQQPVLGLA